MCYAKKPSSDRRGHLEEPNKFIKATLAPRWICVRSGRLLDCASGLESAIGEIGNMWHRHSHRSECLKKGN